MPKSMITGILLLVITLLPGLSAASISKTGLRATNEDTQSGLILSTIDPKTQTLELNTEKTLAVQLLSSGTPIAGANVTWSIERKIVSEISRSSAYFIGPDLEQTSLLTVDTDENGVSEVTLNTGDGTAVYTVKAVSSNTIGGGINVELTQPFEIIVGISASIIETTPEAGIALVLDSLCPKLEEGLGELTLSQQAMLERCNDIQQALSEGKTLEVSKVLRQMSPEEVAVQTVVGSSFSSQQINNIASRLSAVRRGGSGRLSFSGLGFNYGGQSIPLGYMLSSIFSASENDSQVPGLLSNRWGIFANGNASFGSRNATSREDGFEFDNYGLTLGADYRLRTSSFVGVSLGLAKSDIQIDSNGGDMDAAGTSLGVYGTHYFNDRFYLDGIINLGNNDYDMNRHIEFDLGGNATDRTAKSSTSGAQQAATIGAGYEINDGALLINMYGRLNYSRVNIDGFSETGAQELNMKIDEQNIDSLISTLGVQLSYTHSTKWGVLVPFIWYAWEHEYSGESDTIKAAFVDDQFNNSFSIHTEKEDSNYFSSGQGISAVLPHGISLYVRMENIIGKDHYAITNVSVGGRMELTF